MPKDRRRFGVNKDTLDIGFIANRYTPHGEDKGYDLFLQTAHALNRVGIDATYHVVGPWDEAIIPLGQMRGKVKFHGFLQTEALRELSGTLDFVLSPNRPNRLAPGAFDGFPTGSCVEAGLQEAAIFCTDELGLNMQFRDGYDIVLVRPDVDHIVSKVLPVIGSPVGLARLGQSARTSMVRFYDARIQLSPRISMLQAVASYTPRTARKRSELRN